MTNTLHPIATRYAVERLPGEGLLLSALLTPEVQEQLLAELQPLLRTEFEFLVAQQVISQIDLYALTLTYQTTAAADFLKAIYGWSGELEEFDEQRRQAYLQTVHELVTLAHAHVLNCLKGA